MGIIRGPTYTRLEPVENPHKDNINAIREHAALVQRRKILAIIGRIDPNNVYHTTAEQL